MDQDKTELALVRCDNSEAVNYEDHRTRTDVRGLGDEVALVDVGWEGVVGWSVGAFYLES